MITTVRRPFNPIVRDIDKEAELEGMAVRKLGQSFVRRRNGKKTPRHNPSEPDNRKDAA